MLKWVVKYIPLNKITYAFAEVLQNLRNPAPSRYLSSLAFVSDSQIWVIIIFYSCVGMFHFSAYRLKGSRVFCKASTPTLVSIVQKVLNNKYIYTYYVTFSLIVFLPFYTEIHSYVHPTVYSMRWSCIVQSGLLWSPRIVYRFLFKLFSMKIKSLVLK